MAKRSVEFGTIYHFNDNNNYHHENGPSIIYPDGMKIRFTNGFQERKDGPFVDNPSGLKRWATRGQLIWPVL